MLEFLQRKHHSPTSGQYVPYMFDCFMLGNIDTEFIINVKRLQRLLTPKLQPQEYTFRTDKHYFLVSYTDHLALLRGFPMPCSQEIKHLNAYHLQKATPGDQHSTQKEHSLKLNWYSRP